MKKSTLLLALFLISFYLHSQEITRGELFNLFYKAQKAEKAGEFKTAIEIYDNIISIAPQIPEPYLRLGNIYGSFENDKEANQLAIFLYQKYLILEPESKDVNNINLRIAKLQEEQKNTEIVTQSIEKQTPIIVEPNREVVITQKIENVKELPKVENPSTVINTNIPQEKVTVYNEVSLSNYNFNGRWVSDMRVENGREYWILDFNVSNAGLRITINNASAIAYNSFLAQFSTNKDVSSINNSIAMTASLTSSNKSSNNKNYLDAFVTNVAQGQANDKNELSFKYVVDYQYVPSVAKYENQRKAVGWLTGFLGDKYGIGELVGQNIINSDQEQDIAKSILITYDFKLKPMVCGLVGSMRMLHVEKTQSGEKVLTDKLYDCNFYKVPSNYSGFLYSSSTPKDKKDNEKYKSILEKMKKESRTSSDAMNDLGFLHLNGLGTKQNYKEAKKCFEKAAEKGNSTAMNNLSIIYQSGFGLKKADQQQVVGWYEKSASLNDSEAMASLGDLYLMGDSPNPEEAINWYKKAIDAGNAYALYRIGWMLYEGIGFSSDKEKAFEYYSQSIEKGNVAAMNEIANIYLQNKNYTEAFNWYEKAAKKESVTAMRELVYMCQIGLGTEQNYSTAMSWYGKMKKIEANQREGISINKVAIY